MIIKKEFRNYILIIFLYKGGCFSVYSKNKDMKIYDYGWIIKNYKYKYTNYHFSNNWKSKIENEKIKIYGNLFRKKEFSSTPFKHFILRLVSFFSLNIFKFIRKKMIYNNDSSIKFERVIDCNENKLIITDSFFGKLSYFEVVDNYGYDIRHTASAGNNLLLQRNDFSYEKEFILDTKKKIIVRKTYLIND